MNHLINVALVGAGGCAGAVLRYGTSLATQSLLGVPNAWATLTVNTAGCFAAGLLTCLLVRPDGSDSGGADHPFRLLLIVGVLGGLTTFSAFGIETVDLAQRGRFGLAAINVLANVALGLSAAAIGAVAGAAIQRHAA